MNELQMIDFIKDVLWKAAVEAQKETSHNDFRKDEIKLKQNNISRAITLLELLKEPYIDTLKKNIDSKNFWWDREL